MSTYNSPVDIALKTLARSNHINALDAAVAAAFALLPTNDELNLGKTIFAVDTSVADDAYLVALPKTALAYADGMQIIMRPTRTNTGACTVNVDSLGVKAIKTVAGTDPVAGDITLGIPVILIYSSITGFFYTMTSHALQTAAIAAAAAAAASEANAAASEAAAAASAAAAALSAASINIGLGTINGWTAQQYVVEAAITSSSNSVAWNLNTAQHAVHTMTENTTIAAPSNMKAGGTYVLRIVQGSGPYTLAWNAIFDWGEQAAPDAPSADGDVLICSFYSDDGTNMYAGKFNLSEA